VQIGRTLARQQEIITERTARTARLGLESEHVSWAAQRRYADEWFGGSQLLPTAGSLTGRPP